LLAVALLPPGVQAQTTFARVEGYALLSNGPSGSDVQDVDEVFGNGPVQTSANARVRAPAGGIRGGGVAAADFGKVGAFVEGLIYTQDPGSTSAHARSFFSDTLTFDAAGLTGLAGRVTVAYRLGGALHAQATEGGLATASLSMTGRFDNTFGSAHGWLTNENGNVTGTGGPIASDGNPSFIMLTADIVWGQSYETSFESYASTWVTSNGGYEARALVDAPFAGTWGGIVSATHDGVDVAGFTVSALSGTDYSRAFAIPPPVPEAPQMPLLLAGLALVAGWTRRRTRRN
jgi:hypothetical protein